MGRLHSGPLFRLPLERLGYGVAAQFQDDHPETRGFKLPGVLTHWLVSHTRPVDAPEGAFGSGVAAE